MFTQKTLLSSVVEDLQNEFPDLLIPALNSELDSIYAKYCGNLKLEDIFTTDTVYVAAKHCASGFMKKSDTWYYQQSAWINSKILCEKVLSNKFVPKYYKERIISERGKRRVIKPPTFECKVVQKVLCDYIVRPILESRMIETNYASITGRGTKLMYEKIQSVLDELIKTKPLPYLKQNIFITKTDFSGYFGSIDTNLLIYDIIGQYIPDKRIVDLIKKFSPDELGLSLGNEISQIPASYFPSLFDHYCQSHTNWYIFRYMDDILTILPSCDIELYLDKIHEYAMQLYLHVKDEKTQIIPFTSSFIFCKERFLWDKNRNCYYRIQNPAIARNERRKLKKFTEKKKLGLITQENINQHYKSVRGSIANHPNTKKILHELDHLYEETLQT